MLNSLRKLVCFALLFFLLTAFSACSNHLHFDYEPNNLPGLSSDLPRADKLKVAVASFEDVRPNRHDGNLNYALIPFVPSWKEVVSTNQGDGRTTSASYYYPGLLAYAIADDLEHNQMAEIVHLNPAVTEHYDLVVKGKLIKLEFGARKITYGLSFLGPVLQMVLFPTGWLSVDSEIAVEVYTPSIPEPIYSGNIRGSWAEPTYASHEERFLDSLPSESLRRRKIHGVVSSYQEMSKKLLERIAPDIKIIEEEINERTRKESYYSKLDPEILPIVAQVKLANSNYREKTRLARKLQQRISVLERYRQKEFKRLQQEDAVKRNILSKRLEAIKALRNQHTNLKIQSAQVEAEKSKIAKRQYATVARSVAQGMATRNQSGYYTQEQNLQAALQDFSTGASQIQAPNIPAFPTEQLISQLDRNLPGLPAMGADPFAEFGKRTLPEIRERFIAKYKARFR